MSTNLQELAARWVVDHERGSCEDDTCDAHHCPRCEVHTLGRCGSCNMCDLHDEHGEAVSEPLTDGEREHLRAEVHRLITEVKWGTRKVRAEHVAKGLGIGLLAAIELCDAAPESPDCWVCMDTGVEGHIPSDPPHDDPCRYCQETT